MGLNRKLLGITLKYLQVIECEGKSKCFSEGEPADFRNFFGHESFSAFTRSDKREGNSMEPVFRE